MFIIVFQGIKQRKQLQQQNKNWHKTSHKLCPLNQNVNYDADILDAISQCKFTLS